MAFSFRYLRSYFNICFKRLYSSREGYLFEAEERFFSELSSSHRGIVASPRALINRHDVRAKTDARGKVHGIDYRSQ